MDLATGVGSGMDSGTGMDTTTWGASAEEAATSRRTAVVSLAQTNKMLNAITGSTESRGTVSEVSRSEDLGMPAALAETSGGFSNLEATLGYLRTDIGALSMVAMMGQDFGTAAMMRRDSGTPAMTGQDSGMAAMTDIDIGLEAMAGDDSGADSCLPMVNADPSI